MLVKDLNKMLQGVDENLEVLIPMTPEFDGYFKYPCLVESGVTELGISKDTDETQPAFLLVPCGFFDEKHGVQPEDN